MMLRMRTTTIIITTTPSCWIKSRTFCNQTSVGCCFYSMDPNMALGKYAISRGKTLITKGGLHLLGQGAHFFWILTVKTHFPSNKNDHRFLTTTNHNFASVCQSSPIRHNNCAKTRMATETHPQFFDRLELFGCEFDRAWTWVWTSNEDASFDPAISETERIGLGYSYRILQNVIDSDDVPGLDSILGLGRIASLRHGIIPAEAVNDLDKARAWQKSDLPWHCETFSFGWFKIFKSLGKPTAIVDVLMFILEQKSTCFLMRRLVYNPASAYACNVSMHIYIYIY